MRALLPLLWMACSPSHVTLVPGETGAPGGTSEPAEEQEGIDRMLPGDARPDVGAEDPAPTREDDEILSPEIAPIFDDTVLHTVAITLGDEAADALRDDPYEWVEGSVTLDGVPVDPVGIRLRGKIGSFREFDEKPKFKIDFNRYADQEFQDLEALALNNEVVDCGYLKEPAGYAVYHALGLAAPHSSFATVTVDGEDYGLYVLVEVVDDTFLKAYYEEPDGNLYDGKYLYYGGYNYELVDFTPRYQENFTLEEGEDVGLSDIMAITDTLRDDALPFDTRMDAVLDVDQFHRAVVAEQWIGHLDGYTLNRNNYRVYINPWDGRAEIIPWDLDYAFINAVRWGFDWASPSGALAQGCWQDEACLEAHKQAVEDAAAVIDTEALLERVDGWTALIAGAAEADPKRECSRRSVAPAQEEVRGWLEDRAEDMRSYWEDR